MNFTNSFCAASLCIFLASPAQLLDPKEMPENKGSIAGENIYHNPALSMTISLRGQYNPPPGPVYRSRGQVFVLVIEDASENDGPAVQK
jgi:hypothetical protein